jgi:hypothetical protein
MDALSLNLWDEERRGKVEALQWKFGQELLALGLTVIIEWGTWARTEKDTLRLGVSARLLNCIISLHLRMSSSTGFNAGAWRSHP